MDENKIKKCLIKAFREANRNIYEWTDGIKKGGMMSNPTITDIRALTRNWIVRETKGIEDIKKISYYLGKAELSIRLDNRKELEFVEFILIPSSYINEIKMLNDIIKQIDFDDLKYTQASTVMDLSKIESIIF